MHWAFETGVGFHGADGGEYAGAVAMLEVVVRSTSRGGEWGGFLAYINPRPMSVQRMILLFSPTWRSLKRNIGRMQRMKSVAAENAP